MIIPKNYENPFGLCQRFRDQAMATYFEIWLLDDDSIYAKQAANAAFVELHRLENELSRFISNSEISRINALKPNKTIVVSLDCFACVKQAIALYYDTFGAFDISVGKYKETSKTYGSSLKSDLLNLELDEPRKSITLKNSSINLDLGGLGKGYAIDCMVELLREWDITVGLIHGGCSTVRALEPPPDLEGWPISIAHPDQKITYLKKNSLSASGLEKGQHIVDPRNGQLITGNYAAWAWTQTAVVSDALSTAFIIMNNEEVEHYLASHPDVQFRKID